MRIRAALWTAIAAFGAGFSALAERIGSRGLALYQERASEDVLGARWRGLLETL